MIIPSGLGHRLESGWSSQGLGIDTSVIRIFNNLTVNETTSNKNFPQVWIIFVQVSWQAIGHFVSNPWVGGDDIFEGYVRVVESVYQSSHVFDAGVDGIDIIIKTAHIQIPILESLYEDVSDHHATFEGQQHSTTEHWIKKGVCIAH